MIVKNKVRLTGKYAPYNFVLSGFILPIVCLGQVRGPFLRQTQAPESREKGLGQQGSGNCYRPALMGSDLPPESAFLARAVCLLGHNI